MFSERAGVIKSLLKADVTGAFFFYRGRSATYELQNPYIGFFCGWSPVRGRNVLRGCRDQVRADQVVAGFAHQHADARTAPL